MYNLFRNFKTTVLSFLHHLQGPVVRYCSSTFLVPRWKDGTLAIFIAYCISLSLSLSLSQFLFIFKVIFSRNAIYLAYSVPQKQQQRQYHTPRTNVTYNTMSHKIEFVMLLMLYYMPWRIVIWVDDRMCCNQTLLHCFS